MKTLITVLALFAFATAFSQQGTDKKVCPDCNIPCMCQDFFAPYLKDKAIIKDNWNDFFGADITNVFPMPAGANTVTIKFDGLGCLYPESNPALNSIKEEFLDKSISYKYLYSHTFYNLYQRKEHKKSTTQIDAFINNENFGAVKTYTNEPYIDYFDFITRWNAKHLPLKITEIENKITPDIKKIVFFIHGYNVPYSLAALQNKKMMDQILEANPELKINQILLIKVLWPSGDRKKNNFDSNPCDYSNIEKPKTVIAFTYYSNRAYLAGVYLRKILRDMHCNLPIDIVTHSHGSAIATTALIKTKSKLQKGWFSDELITLIDTTVLPNKDINVFLNAPSIPGVNTFTDVTKDSKQERYRFFVGYNEKDEVLKKQKFRIYKLKVKFIAPTKHLSATTLGCNKDGEVKLTKDLMESKGMDNIFYYGINSFQKEHDFFCYIKQTEFKRNLKLFFNGAFR